MNPTFKLSNDDFDCMHDTLGRPADPRTEQRQNSLCVFTYGPDYERLREIAEATGFWQQTRTANDGRSAIFEVTPAGIEALADWLNRPMAPREPNAKAMAKVIGDWLARRT